MSETPEKALTGKNDRQRKDDRLSRAGRKARLFSTASATRIMGFMTRFDLSFPSLSPRREKVGSQKQASEKRAPALGLAFGLALSFGVAGNVALAPAAFAQAAATATAASPNASPSAGDAGSSAAPTAAPVAPGATTATTGPESAPVSAEPLAPNAESATADAAPAENPYGLKALWKNGDIIARSVLLIMAAMSAGSWVIIVMKFIEESRLFAAARAAARTFWNQPTVQEGAKTLKTDSPFRYIAETGIIAAQHHEGSLRDSIDLPSWTSISIQRAVDTIHSRLQSGLAFLGTVGSTSPFIGLFGTVWGIYHALTAIGIAGQASIDKVAGPVGESLIMTAIGLATAVPAVLGYNLLVRRNKAAMDRVRNFASDIQSVLLGGYRHATVFDAVKNGGDSEPPVTITSSSRV